MKTKIKNWWFAAIGILAIILDQGFSLVDPILSDIGASRKLIGFIKIVFGVYGIIKLHRSLPTSNPDKLKKLAEDKLSSIGGSTPPPGKDEK